MVNATAQNTSPPLDYSLGEASKRIIVHQQDDLLIIHDHLVQDVTPTRFYHNPVDTFLFLLKGEVYLQQYESSNVQNIAEEITLKKHQGIWLNANTINSVTLLTPRVELCLIRLSTSVNTKSTHPFEKISSGTVELQLGRNQIKVWPLWETEHGRIALELYPTKYNETLYYHKAATQYFLPLNGSAVFMSKSKTPTSCPSIGKVVPPKEAVAILNPGDQNSIVLSVMTKDYSEGRVHLLTRT
ncbi:hypothetical protein [Marinomonas foliarum]|uniref:Mannose-6-phosphate isomerase-like protein (Cupin superfamily) n=1 Tax=Marinomonas foliarum TaxID=491950 RepID=A0ABX7IMP1_9GAMM|nr:hypothetical protein [Marinomonas foliarum]QRV23585.1 hypothetical protein JSY38_16350 [Marinomonas foliarum]